MEPYQKEASDRLKGVLPFILEAVRVARKKRPYGIVELAITSHNADGSGGGFTTNLGLGDLDGFVRDIATIVGYDIKDNKNGVELKPWAPGSVDSPRVFRATEWGEVISWVYMENGCWTWSALGKPSALDNEVEASTTDAMAAADAFLRDKGYILKETT